MNATRFALPDDDDRSTKRTNATARKVLDASKHLALNFYKTDEGRTTMDFKLEGTISHPNDDDDFQTVENAEAERAARDLLAAFLGRQ